MPVATKKTDPRKMPIAIFVVGLCDFTNLKTARAGKCDNIIKVPFKITFGLAVSNYSPKYISLTFPA